MSDTAKNEAYEGWTILELMGHRRLGGYVREAAELAALVGDAGKKKPAKGGAKKKASPKKAPARAADAGEDDDDDAGGDSEPVFDEDDEPRCRVCHCTERDACMPRSCSWAEDDLCSECVAHVDEQRDETWRRLFKKQGLSFQRIADRWGVTLEEVEAVCVPAPAPAAKKKRGKAKASTTETADAR